jgi:ATP-dependent RNA helicase DDX24/MAK5
MAPQKPKRDRPVPTTSQRSKKRQKVETIKDGYAPAGAGSDVRKVPVALDSLPWNEVEMPDMFEDAEGFFGLDEVDNVEVLRDGNQVKFVST